MTDRLPFGAEGRYPAVDFRGGVSHRTGMRVLVWAGLLAVLASGPGIGTVQAATARVPASEIPLKGPYRYDRGWYHKVQMGDTLAELANRFGVELTYLTKVNGLKPGAFLVLGSYLYIPPHSGYFYSVKRGDTLDAVARKYHLDVDYLAATNRIRASTRLRTGEILIIPTRMRPAPIPKQPKSSTGTGGGTAHSTHSGIAGGSSSSHHESSTRSGTNRYSIQRDPIADRQSSVAGMVDVPTRRLEIPMPKHSRETPGGGDRAARSETRSYSEEHTSTRSTHANRSVHESHFESATAAPHGTISRRRGSDGRPVFRWPLEGTVTRGYVNKPDQKHRGVDIAAPMGTIIRAAADGTVIYSGNDIPGYGNMVIIDHGRSWATCYAHNSVNLVKKDQKVGAGQPVAKVGETGRATGPHCHFEVRYKYQAIDPMPLLP